MCSTNRGLPSTQVFPSGRPKSHSQYCFNTDLHDKVKTIPCNQFHEVWYYGLNDIDVTVERRNEGCLSVVSMERSTGFHRNSGRGCFTTRRFEARTVACCSLKL